ncbi:ABC transporter substrate-binding protein [Aerococcus urinaeequi]|uniref:ABC transporter substrate-binding protein n=1 Tax=Aerococcus urinaeequi TaxID=51665 RepID=UPI003B3B455B
MLADSDIQTIEDLEGKTIGGVAGSHKVDIMTQYIEDKSLDIEIRTYENREGTELAVEKGQVQAYVQDYAIIQSSITLKDKPFRTLEETYSDDSVVFPFAQTDQGTELKEAFDAELEKLREDGTLAELSEKYYGEDITQE